MDYQPLYKHQNKIFPSRRGRRKRPKASKYSKISFFYLIFFAGFFCAAVTYSIYKSLAINAPPTHVLPVTYYVSSKGNDSSDGQTVQSAWRSISRVNQQPLKPGDKVLFEGGSTFLGKLYFHPGESGSSSAPIAVSSFGNSRATISNSSDDSLFVYNAAGIDISDLNFNGGTNLSKGNGISFYNDLPGDVTLGYIRISNVDVSGFKYGIIAGGGNGVSGFEDIDISNSTAHNNRLAGIMTYGPEFKADLRNYTIKDIHINYAKAYNNLGDPSLKVHSGDGIVLGSVNIGTIENSIAYNNGTLCTAKECAVGIWTYNSNSMVIQHNESYANHTSGPVDGDGFSLDINTSNSLAQYNYSHDNDGSGYLIYTSQDNAIHNNNVVRYNVSQNDGRKNSYGGIFIGGRLYSTAIYNNTVYLDTPPAGKPPAITILSADGYAVSVRNNILLEQGNLPVVTASKVDKAKIMLQGNNYYSYDTHGFNVAWAGATFSSLSAWRKASGQEVVNGSPSGLSVDPKLVGPGQGSTIGNSDLLPTLTVYKLQDGSPMINAGLNLTSLFGTNIGDRDFYGTSIPSGQATDIGASEF